MMSVFICLEMYTIGPAVKFNWSLKSQFTPKSKVLVFFLPVMLFMHPLFWCEQLSFKDIGWKSNLVLLNIMEQDGKNYIWKTRQQCLFKKHHETCDNPQNLLRKAIFFYIQEKGDIGRYLCNSHLYRLNG